ncbi:MAG: type II CAAX endopeptidase family protein [Candidatus Micrarchaeota archaeon]
MRRIFLFLSISSILLFASVTACGFFGWGSCAFLTDNALYLGSGAIHFGLISLALFFLWKGDIKSTMEPLGFPGKPLHVILFSVATLAAIFVVLLVLGIASMLLGFNDQQNVTDKIADLPLIVLIFAALGAPITEELFFRGFLTDKFGIIGSSLLFGMMHVAYGSLVEVIGAFLIGVVLAIAFKMSKSITPCILAHMAYNALAITVMVMFA